MSPRPNSRSQTPQMPFPGYQGAANGQPQFAHHSTPYQHLQGTPTNAAQSPGLPDFDQHGAQRVQTASPSPFSPAGPHVTSQISPSHSEQGSRVNTPQTANFLPGQGFPQGMPPQFSPSPAMSSAALQATMQAHFNNMQQAGYSNPAMAAQQQRLYQMQMNQARQMQSNNVAMGARPTGAMNQIPNAQMAALRQMQQNMTKPGSTEGIMRSLQKFMVSRKMPLDPNPLVCGRPINLVHLYTIVIKLGGSQKITATNMWPMVAQQLQFPVEQYPSASQEIQTHYLRNLAAYEQAFLSSQQKQLTDQYQQNAAQRQPANMNAMPYQQSPVKPGFDPSHHFSPSPQSGQSVQGGTPQNLSNGFMPPQPVRPPSKQAQQPPQPTQPQPPPSQQPQPPSGPQSQQQLQQHQHRASISRQSQPPAATQDPSVQPPATQSAQPGKTVTGTPRKAAAAAEQANDASIQRHIGDVFKPMSLPESNRHGPIVIDEIYPIGEDLTRLKPNVPAFGELGVIDIHALTMSIRSGLHAEMRVALDTLTTISCDPVTQIALENCGDLVETLVECAEQQLEMLVEHAADVSDVIRVPSYEEVVRGCRQEMSTLVDIPEFGSIEYELDRAVDRIICVTTILRNFSFTEFNADNLGIPEVVSFFASVVRNMGTCRMLLRTHQNTLDFMKDAVIYLSNLAHTIHLPGKEEALSLLHFLLAFAPLPLPTINSESVMFGAYTPTVHKYTPAAIDSLAKLLARDEPNRMYYRAIFAGEGSGTQQELLTRAFGLAICPLPDQPRKPVVVADMRKVFIMQGLLAADILTDLADGHAARLWLNSSDGFAVHLFRLCCLLCTDSSPPANPRQARGQQAENDSVHASIINRGLTILLRLAEKAKQDDSSSTCLPIGILPKRENLLGALLTPTIDRRVVKQLLAFAGVGES